MLCLQNALLLIFNTIWIVYIFLPEIGFNVNLKVERIWWEDGLFVAPFYRSILFSGSLHAPIHYQRRQGEENLHKEIRTDLSVKKCFEGLDTLEMCRPLHNCTESSSSCFILFVGIGFLFVRHPLPGASRKMTSNQADLLIYSEHGFVLAYCAGCAAFSSYKDVADKRNCLLLT